jgi:MFS family permease
MLRDRLGLLETSDARPFVSAMLVDALGSGLFLPFSLLYFHHASGLPLTQAGFGLSVAMLAALPVPLLGGVLIDRAGPKQLIVATNAARAIGFLGYLLVHNLATLIPIALLVATSDRLFWAAQPAVIAEIAPSGARDRWFGLITAVRCAGLGAGGLLAGIAVTGETVGAYQALAVANAASFALCAALIARLRLPDPDPNHPGSRGAAVVPRRFWTVLADRPFAVVVLANLAFGIARTAILVGLPVYTVQALGAPAWLAGALYTLYTAMIAIGQTTLVRRLEPHRRTRALMLAAGIWAASFVLLALALLLPRLVLVPYLFGVTAIYTIAVMLHAGVIDALVVEAAPKSARGRYVATYQTSWALANALAPGLLTMLLAVTPAAPWVALTVLVTLAFAGVWALEAHLAPAAVRARAAEVPVVRG